jgi:polygalacturonase
MLSAGLRAQDTRHVTEPHFAQVCTVLNARLEAPNSALSEASERTPDTARIQTAIDQCRQGHAVELKGADGNQIFLTGPLQLKPGVTLLVDAGVALFASRNPRDYDASPGSCSVSPARGSGCKPLIAANHAPGSGIMGDGVIDGRGGAKLLGQEDTWWDISKRAKVMDITYTAPRLIAVTQSDDFTLYRITLRNSFNFHVAVNQTNGFTAWGVKIKRRKPRATPTASTPPPPPM